MGVISATGTISVCILLKWLGDNILFHLPPPLYEIQYKFIINLGDKSTNR